MLENKGYGPNMNAKFKPDDDDNPRKEATAFKRELLKIQVEVVEGVDS
jgi:hypothetical protein